MEEKIKIVENEKNCLAQTIKNRGITLVALVITIIVLIILAGVGINLVLGDNGIIQKAQQSKTDTEIAQIKEKVQIDIAGVLAGNETVGISKSQLKTILNKYFDNVPEDYILDTELTAKDEYGSHKIKISDLYNGAMEETITAQDIANAENKKEYYGAEVKGYTLPSETITDVGWKIFYADEKNIYLISDNYVERTNLPNSTTADGIVTSNKLNDGSNPRAAHFINIIGDYSTGSSRITDNRLKALNNDYFNTKKYTSTNNNMKAVAYMMDTTAWNSKFKDVNNKAEYVIGGPTIEMMMNSYSEKYGVNYKARARSPIGYEISANGVDNWSCDISGLFNINDSLYVLSSSKDSNGMWFASPSGADSEGLVFMYNSGKVYYSYYYQSNGYGFRPLVCLKSEVQLQKKADGTYTIK